MGVPTVPHGSVVLFSSFVFISALFLCPLATLTKQGASSQTEVFRQSRQTSLEPVYSKLQNPRLGSNYGHKNEVDVQHKALVIVSTPQTPIRGILASGIVVPAINPLVLTNADLIIAVTPELILEQEKLIAQANADVVSGLTTPLEVETIRTNAANFMSFARLVLFNAEDVVAVQLDRIAQAEALTAAGVTVVGVSAPPLQPNILANGESIVANSEVVINAQRARIAEAEADFAAGLITQAEAGEIVTNAENIITFAEMGVVNARDVISVQFARDVISAPPPPPPTNLVIDKPEAKDETGGILGDLLTALLGAENLVKVQNSKVLNTLEGQEAGAGAVPENGQLTRTLFGFGGRARAYAEEVHLERESGGHDHQGHQEQGSVVPYSLSRQQQQPSSVIAQHQQNLFHVEPRPRTQPFHQYPLHGNPYFTSLAVPPFPLFSYRQPHPFLRQQSHQFLGYPGWMSQPQFQNFIRYPFPMINKRTATF